MDTETVPINLDSSTLLRPRDAAKQLAISERTLHQLKESGEVSSVRVGNQIRYSLIDLVDYVKRNKVMRKESA